MVLRQVLHRLSGLQLLLVSKTLNRDTRTCASEKQPGYGSDWLKGQESEGVEVRSVLLLCAVFVQGDPPYKCMEDLDNWSLGSPMQAIHSSGKNGPTVKPCSKC